MDEWPVDPHVMGTLSIYSKSLGDYYLPTDDGEGCAELLNSALERIDQLDADLYESYYLNGIDQCRLAKIFGMSQPTVRYRLLRAAERIRYFIDLPRVEKKDVPRYNISPRDRSILYALVKGGTVVSATKAVGLEPRFVRARMKKLLGTTSEKVGKMLTYILENDRKNIRPNRKYRETLTRIVDLKP